LNVTWRNFSLEYRYRKTIPLPRYYRILFTVPTVLPWNFPRPSGNYRGYRGITTFAVTVSSGRNQSPIKKSVSSSYNVQLLLGISATAVVLLCTFVLNEKYNTIYVVSASIRYLPL